MAQYQRNFYGTSYYGETNAFSGTYETAEILTEEPLNSTFDVNITAVMPHATYNYNAPEVIQAVGTWTVVGSYLTSSSANAKLTFAGTCDRLVINYKGEPTGIGSNVNVKVTTTALGGTPVVTTYSFSTDHAVTNDYTYIISDLPYGKQEVEIYLDAAPTNAFYFKSIEARVCSFTIETRAKTGIGGVWSAYQKATLTSTPIVNRIDGYTLTATSPNYMGSDRIQVRVWLASSDNDVSPIIEELDTYSGDTNNRTEDGSWTATLDMTNIASALSKVFQEIISVDWTSTEPTSTKITIRTRSTSDATKTNWSPQSVPYHTNIKRLRIKEQFDQGYIITSLINPASLNPNLRTDHWENWNDISYLPPDESGTEILYEFLDEKDEVLYKASQPRYITDKSLISKTIGNKPYRIRITLSKRVDKSSPTVDSISLISNMIYEEKKFTNNYDFSAVDNRNTGNTMILDMADLTFNPPAQATTPSYFLEDKTQRPRDVTLYWESTNALPAGISKPNFTNSAIDKVWAKMIVDTKPTDGIVTGVYKHYQYGGGSVILAQQDEIEMATAFTPTLNADRRYRYYLKSGWYNPETDTTVDDTLNANVDIFWKPENLVNPRTYLTDKSSHNTIILNIPDRSSEIVIAKVKIDSTFGEVEWVSDEKIYSGVVNINDEKVNYVRTHTTPESGDSIEMMYKVVISDTYATIAAKLGVDEQDLRYANKALESEEPLVGMTIVIPARIVLPAINPAARVGPNPYYVDIIYNSVRQGGKVVPESRIQVKGLTVIEEEVTIKKERIVRGPILNGRDLLGNAKVIEVLGIWDAVDDPVLPPNYQPTLDYTVDGNYIVWGATDAGSREPNVGVSYYVSYKCKKPKSITIVISCNYQEEGGIDRIWRSPEIKQFNGTCAPKVDFKAELPNITTWEGTADPKITDLEYIIEDNDLWVKTWVQYDISTSKYYTIGSLQDRIPKDNWLPYIHTGYYYVGNQEYYMFSEPLKVTPGKTDIPQAQNIEYVPAKFSDGAKFENGTKNLVHNSGFEIANTKQIVYKVDYTA